MIRATATSKAKPVINSMIVQQMLTNAFKAQFGWNPIYYLLFYVSPTPPTKNKSGNWKSVIKAFVFVWRREIEDFCWALFIVIFVGRRARGEQKSIKRLYEPFSIFQPTSAANLLLTFSISYNNTRQQAETAKKSNNCQLSSSFLDALTIIIDNYVDLINQLF